MITRERDSKLLTPQNRSRHLRRRRRRPAAKPLQRPGVQRERAATKGGCSWTAAFPPAPRASCLGAEAARRGSAWWTREPRPAVCLCVTSRGSSPCTAHRPSSESRGPQPPAGRDGHPAPPSPSRLRQRLRCVSRFHPSTMRILHTHKGRRLSLGINILLLFADNYLLYLLSSENSDVKNSVKILVEHRLSIIFTCLYFI